MNARDDNRRKSPRILVADDNLESADRVRQILRSGGYRQVKTLSIIDSFEQLRDFDVVVLDIVWPPGTRPKHERSEYFGFAGLRYLRTYSPTTRVVLTSRHLFDLESLQEIQHADAYFKADADGSEILHLVGATVLRESTRRSQADEIAGYLDLLEQVLLDGRADLFGLRSEAYENLLREIRVLKTEASTAEASLSAWKSRLDLLNSMATGAKNLTDVIEAVSRLVPG